MEQLNTVSEEFPPIEWKGAIHYWIGQKGHLYLGSVPLQISQLLLIEIIEITIHDLVDLVEARLAIASPMRRCRTRYCCYLTTPLMLVIKGDGRYASAALSPCAVDNRPGISMA